MNVPISFRLPLTQLHSLPIQRAAPGQKVPPIRTQARSATILPNFVGLVFQVHNGKIYNDVLITEDMVGHKLGEFSAYEPPFWQYYHMQRADLGLGQENASHTSRARTSRGTNHTGWETAFVERALYWQGILGCII
jgi:ribosomal protein S19